MTADAAAIPDAETIVADVTVDVTMAGVLPCLAAEEAAAPAFSGLSVSCAAAETQNPVKSKVSNGKCRSNI
jgi:hypothetical protein